MAAERNFIAHKDNTKKKTMIHKLWNSQKYETAIFQQKIDRFKWKLWKIPIPQKNPWIPN